MKIRLLRPPPKKGKDLRLVCERSLRIIGRILPT
jgi:hypothetical protein